MFAGRRGRSARLWGIDLVPTGAYRLTVEDQTLQLVEAGGLYRIMLCRAAPESRTAVVARRAVGGGCGYSAREDHRECREDGTERRARRTVHRRIWRQEMTAAGVPSFMDGNNAPETARG